MRDRKGTAASQQICAQVSTVQPEGLMGNGGRVWARPTGDFSKQQVGVSIVCVWRGGGAAAGWGRCAGGRQEEQATPSPLAISLLGVYLTQV